MFFLSVFIITSCESVNQSKNSYTDIDSLWLPFENALDINNASFLVKNSLDSIVCTDCMIGVDFDNEKFESKYIFNTQLTKVRHLHSLHDIEFSTYLLGDSIIRVLYNIKAKESPEGNYGLIFTLIKINDKYLLKSMIVQ